MSSVRVVPQRATVIGYERSLFGHSWATSPATGPGCTTRERELVRQMNGTRLGTGCRPQPGTVVGPYTGTVIGGDNPVELDHIYPLSAAWDMGAYSWDSATRHRFANDPANLVVVQKKANRDKSDSLPGEWMPPQRAHRCWYARRVAAVAAAYDLPLTTTDIRVMVTWCPTDWIGLVFLR
ncbi:HNH endonuclease [Corynebacterium sp. CCM 8862]|uniref:HNH endonuclease n=1 Tax=Corynebacterium mendelii TaxID=2765362 RepID=A0A939IYQ1_9CORY|nr:HNH endonuclease [Corynebacterium mendelii]